MILPWNIPDLYNRIKRLGDQGFGGLPENPLIYRDGVSEGQYQAGSSRKDAKDSRWLQPWQLTEAPT